MSQTDDFSRITAGVFSDQMAAETEAEFYNDRVDDAIEGIMGAWHHARGYCGDGGCDHATIEDIASQLMRARLQLFASELQLMALGISEDGQFATKPGGPFHRAIKVICDHLDSRAAAQN